MKYPVYEVFNAWQGEGTYVGLSAFFIRLFGCPIRCDFCDSAGTWHHNYVPVRVERMSEGRLAQVALQNPSVRMVVVTGGEPCIHDLDPLCDEMYEWDLPVHLETSGTFPIKNPQKFEHIVMSPKWAKLPLVENYDKATELKLIVENGDSISKWWEIVHNFKGTIWLHPEWSQRQNSLVLNSINKAVMSDTRFRAGYQLHKLYNVDSLDSRSQKLVPLGGKGEVL